MSEPPDSAIDLHEVESAIAAAICGGGINSLRLLGHGEVSIVLAWPQASPTVALWDGSTATQLDFTSPFVLTPNRKDMTYDAQASLQEYPLVLRPYLKRELTTIIRRYTTAEGALLPDETTYDRARP